MTSYHLIVLVHGLWGNVTHFDYITSVLQDHAEKSWHKHKDEQLLIYRTALNEGFKTYDGIDVCGYRVAQEIVDQIEIIEKTTGNDVVTKFSMVGYSLGGLISRYALGLLYKRQYFKKRDIQLINFTTFCTPHVGVLAPGRNMAVKIFNSTVPWLLGSSGKQIFLKDSVTTSGVNGTNQDQPLIYLMSLENTVFFKALQSFKYRSLYANIINDKRTAWWTAGISLNDPFFNIDEFNGVKVFHYIEGFDTVVVDRKKMIVISQAAPESEEDENSMELAEVKNGEELLEQDPRKRAEQDYYFLNYWFVKMGKWILVIINLLIIAPLLLIWKIVQSAAEMTISTIRVTRFLNKYSHQIVRDFFELPVPMNSDPDDYIPANDRGSSETNYGEDDIYSTRSSLRKTSSIISSDVGDSTFPMEYGAYLGLEESLNDQADFLMESLYDAIERKNTRAGFIEEARSDSSKPDENSLVVSIMELESKSIEQLTAKHGREREPLIKNLDLNLPATQRAIIRSLNKLDWEKYPIYIRKTVSTHACAIVRQMDPDFEEGKVVVDHWVKNVFRRG